MYSILDIVFIFAGIWLLLQCYNVKYKGDPFNVKAIFPPDMTADKCSDMEAFHAFMIPRAFVMGVIMMLYSLLSFTSDQFDLLNPTLDLIIFLIVFVGLLILYNRTVKTARALFWKEKDQ